MKLTNVIKLLEDFAPPDIASFDHVGFLVGSKNSDKKIKKIGLTLDATIETITNAAKANCDLLITHHGPNDQTFNPLSKLDKKRIQLATLADLPIYRMHLNLDFCKNGNSETLCSLLEFKKPRPFPVMYKTHKLPVGLHMIDGLFTLQDLIQRVKKLKLNSLRIVPSRKKVFRRVVIAPGEGFVPEFLEQAPNIDVFISGELNHIAIVRARDLNICLIELTHATSENEPLKVISHRLTKMLNVTVEFIESQDNIQVVPLR